MKFLWPAKPPWLLRETTNWAMPSPASAHQLSNDKNTRAFRWLCPNIGCNYVFSIWETGLNQEWILGSSYTNSDTDILQLSKDRVPHSPSGESLYCSLYNRKTTVRFFIQIHPVIRNSLLYVQSRLCKTFTQKICLSENRVSQNSILIKIE